MTGGGVIMTGLHDLIPEVFRDVGFVLECKRLAGVGEAREVVWMLDDLICKRICAEALTELVLKLR